MNELSRKALFALLALQRFSWEQGCLIQACLEAGENELLEQTVRAAILRTGADGRPAQAGHDGSAVDACSCGEGIAVLAKRTGDPFYTDALDRLLSWALERAPRSGAGAVYHLMHEAEYWSDSPYMMPPFLAAAGKYEEALNHIRCYIGALRDPETGLMRHICRFKDAEEASDEADAAALSRMPAPGAEGFDAAAENPEAVSGKLFFRDASLWGVGNGWTMAGIARVIDMLPAEMQKEREELIRLNRSLLDHVLPLCLPDGSFRNALDDNTSFAEYNLSQMTAYTIYRGIKSGWLPDNPYLQTADRLRLAVEAHVDSFGFLQPVCGMPTFDRPGVAPEGQAFFVMMEAACHRIL